MMLMGRPITLGNRGQALGARGPGQWQGRGSPLTLSFKAGGGSILGVQPWNPNEPAAPVKYAGGCSPWTLCQAPECFFWIERGSVAFVRFTKSPASWRRRSSYRRSWRQEAGCSLLLFCASGVLLRAVLCLGGDGVPCASGLGQGHCFHEASPALLSALCGLGVPATLTLLPAPTLAPCVFQ